ATFRRTVFDNKVYPLDITELLKALPEGVELGRILSRRYRFQHADPPHLRRLLRAYRAWPRRRRAAEKGDEFAPRPRRSTPHHRACPLRPESDCSITIIRSVACATFDHMHCSKKACLFDHLVGSGDERRWDLRGRGPWRF